MNIGVFIDLNTYRLTANMLDSLLAALNHDYDIDSIIYYNYSPLTHRDLPIDIANTREFGSGRRKVLIDMREVCDMIDYAATHERANIFAICGLLDSEYVWEKLHSLNAKITLAAPQSITANVDEIYLLNRQPLGDSTKSHDIALTFSPQRTARKEQLRQSPTISTKILSDNITPQSEKSTNHSAVSSEKSTNHSAVSSEKSAAHSSVSSEKLDVSATLPQKLSAKHSTSFDDYDSKLREIDSLITALYR